ncbi:diacylglycerol kinase family lipid kinase [Staphylococcus sp. SQ8-PEA]|uniref:Diacylglycerol kinase family lipid kinase n=1 Tax=Staphylococcus marylandisciuri TaxID=2981529 RepID=A0ABT2QPC0_9STAP|nr:diacylglycerol kinase family protein [Staphylococcus marylandisciuri]MCU5745814.1 diacylglycerol kinase family lipid kinase [Staphylococcus marylandisciuri]
MSKNYQHGVLFYHEHSGIDDIYEGLGVVTHQLTQLCKRLSIQLSENEGDIIKYCEQIKDQQYSDDIDILFILGGDGTVNELVTGVMQHELNIPIAVIPGGTFNDFTKTLNLDGDYTKACKQLLNAEPEPYDVIKVNDEYALNFVGMGLIVQNAENVQEGNKDLFGRLSYIGSTVKTLLDPIEFNYTLTSDGETLTGQTSMLIIANGPHIGGGRIPLTDLSPNDGYLDTFIFKHSKMSVVKDIFKKRDSMNWNKVTDGITHLHGKKISIETNKELSVDIDGEIALTTPLEIEVLPQAIRILTLKDKA